MSNKVQPSNPFKLFEPIKSTRCDRRTGMFSKAVNDDKLTNIFNEKVLRIDVEHKLKQYNYHYNVYQRKLADQDPSAQKEVTALKEIKKQIFDEIRFFTILKEKRINDFENEPTENFIVSDYVYKLANIFGDRILSLIAPFNDEVRNYFKNNEKIKYVDRIQPFNNRLLEIQNEVLIKHAEITKPWRPKTITKESIKQRMQDPAINESFRKAIQVCINRSKKKPSIEEVQEIIMNQIESIKYCDLDLNEKLLIKLSEDIDLIIDGKNCCIVFKTLEVGSGGTKHVYAGLDLTKNRAIALGYIENKNSAKEALEREEHTYCLMAGKDLNTEYEINSKNRIVKHINFLKFEGKAVFISELYDYDLKNYIISEAIKNECSLCMELIDVNFELLCKGIIFKDLKTENFYIDSEGHIKLGDLDIKSYGSISLPPEIWKLGLLEMQEKKWEKDYGEDQLIWALGLVLFQTYFKRGMPLIRQIWTEKQKKNGKNGKLDFTVRRGWEKFEPFMTSLSDSDISSVIIDSCSTQKDDPFANIIKSMLRIDPDERPSLKEVQERWDEAMKNQGDSIPQNEELLLDVESLQILEKQRNLLEQDLEGAKAKIGEKHAADTPKLKKLDEEYENDQMSEEDYQTARTMLGGKDKRKLEKLQSDYDKGLISDGEYQRGRMMWGEELEDKLAALEANYRSNLKDLEDQLKHAKPSKLLMREPSREPQLVKNDDSNLVTKTPAPRRGESQDSSFIGDDGVHIFVKRAGK